jgi:hypothetical protein
MSQSTTAYVSEALTADISLVTGTTYDCMDQTVAASVAYPQLASTTALPVYWDSTEGVIKSMSSQDFIDTFIDPAIDYLVSGNTEASTVLKQGTYFISTASSVTNATLISSNPIFADTTANAGSYTSGGIPEALDQPTIENNYYLHRYDQQEPVGHDKPLFWNADVSPELSVYGQSEIDALFAGYVQEAAANEVGYRIRYDVSTSGAGGGFNVVGSSIINTTLNGTSAAGYTTRLVNANDYRSQEFPNGIPTAVNTWYLRISRS